MVMGRFDQETENERNKLESDIKLLRQVISDNSDKALRFISESTFTLRRIQSDLERLRDLEHRLIRVVEECA